MMSLAAVHSPPILDRRESPGGALLAGDTHTHSEYERESQLIENILLQTEDLSSLSPELLRRAVELGVWYHFNPFRTSAVRVFDLPTHCRVLEISCGAGVVTRYLAEQGCRVTAIESNGELARCARLRCAGMHNVEIVDSYLDPVISDDRFDVVLCLDPNLVESEFYGPGIELFAMCRRLLRPTGSFILAVGNSIGQMGDSHAELSRDHVRGRGAPLGSLRESLSSVGFSHYDTFLAFPHHAAPQLLVEPMQSRTKRVAWLSLIHKVFRGSPRAVAELERWWRMIHAEYLDSALAPGWILVAHAQHVHEPLWSGWALSEVFLAEGIDAQVEAAKQGDLRTVRLVVSDSGLREVCLERCAPDVVSREDLRDRIASRDRCLEQVSEEQRNLRSKVAHKRLLSRAKLRAERWSRKHREAELDLVLKHAHSVGASWREVSEQKAQLEERYAQLQQQYEAAEERLLDLASASHQAELELSTFKGSWLWRACSFCRRLWVTP